MRSKACTALLFAALTVASVGTAAADIAVVVNPKVPIENLKFSELRRILRGDRQFWSGRSPVTLLIRATPSPERTALLETVYEMTEPQFKQYWVAKVFRAETLAAPKFVLTNQMSVDLVGALDGAITLLDMKDVRSGMKVVKVDGRLPGEKDYALK